MKELISKLLQKEIKDRLNINELMEKEEIKKHMIQIVQEIAKYNIEAALELED